MHSWTAVAVEVVAVETAESPLGTVGTQEMDSECFRTAVPG